MFKITKNWQEILKAEFEKDYFLNLKTFLKKEYEDKKIFPSKENVFNAFNQVEFEDVKVVVIGQDPYHGEGQAHGLCFSVLDGVKTPPSLKNIFKEIKNQCGYQPLPSGNLERWAKQGVLLLNAVLTVEEAKANSHKNKGWETFTKKVVKLLSERHEQVIFVLWGNYAKKFKKLIDEKTHIVLESAHPSPLSAFNGFWGNGHFLKINQILIGNNQKQIDWH